MLDIADELDTTLSTVSRWMGEHGIETQLGGIKHPEWKGGESLDYGPNWLEQREKRIEKDGGKCVVCHQTREGHINEHGIDLHVHHIKPINSFDEETGYEVINGLDNLITLCVSCHRKWEGIPIRPQT